MLISVLIILGSFIILSYYIGVKVKQAIPESKIRFKNKTFKILYWTIYWGIALSFILSNILRSFLSEDNWITESLKLIGAAYLGIFIYSILIFPFIDITRFILKKIKFNASIKRKLKLIYFDGISIFVIIFIIVGFGAWNAQDKVVTNYEVTISKNVEKISSLNIIMISDAHIGIGVRENSINKMVNSINELNPDIVVFCGDIFDDSTSTKLKEYSSKAFKNIKSKYGTYAITGNHEYGAGELSDTITYFEDANIKYLRDESIKIVDSFYIVGRNDQGNNIISGHKTTPLNEILKNADRSLPIIVLNHRPDKLEEAEAENIDLQLSGHTHSGQIFPGNLIIKSIYEDAYGYLKKGDFNLIVSSGYGTWGPPIRIGSKSEIVNILVNFKK